MMKTIRVVAALIEKDGKVFSVQRGYGDFKGGWEFPGGKIESHETEPEALAREIQEELDADIDVLEKLYQVEYDYPNFHLSMGCYICRLKNEHLILKEHEAAKWLDPDTLDSVNWLPADIEVAQAWKSRKSKED